MLSALTLVVLIASGDAKDPVAQSMDKALHQALGAETRVLFRPMSEGDAVTADAVVTIVWRENRVTLRMHAGDRWIDREIGFAAGDADAERGRTLGFAIASMLPERTEPPPAPVPPPPPPLPPPPAKEQPPPIHVDPPRLYFLEGSFAGSAGGNAGGIGGGLHGGWRFLRAGASVRVGDLDVASMVHVALSTGARLRLIEPRPLGLSARGEVLLMHDVLERDSVSRGRWLPGAAAMIEGLFSLGPRLFFYTGLGVEIAFGKTDVLVQGQTVLQIAPVRGVGEAGLRLEL
jgi:hypothetical protein